MKKINSLFIRFTVGIGSMLLIACFVLLFSGCSKDAASVISTAALSEPEPVNQTLTGELNISVFHENEYLQLAAKKYEESHEGVTVKINKYLDSAEAGTEGGSDKYAQIVNTSLISGNGDDIIDVDPLSYFTLADKKMLVDLNQYLDVNNDNYYMNIMDAYLYKGSRYTVPLSFIFNGYYINEETARSGGIQMTNSNFNLEDLVSFSEQLPEDTKLFDGNCFGTSDISLAFQLFSFDLKQFINMETKEADVNNKNFISMLEKVKSLSDKKRIASAGEDTFYTYSDEERSLLNESTIFTPATCSQGVMDFSNLQLLVNKAGFSAFSNVGFKPAVSNGSKNKELAADFILFLLSEEVQTSTELLYCPVNRNSVKETSQLLYESIDAGGWLPDGFNEETLQNNIIKFNELTEKTKCIDYLDRNIANIVTDEIKKYFLGEETAEEAAENLQIKLNAYLKEY